MKVKKIMTADAGFCSAEENLSKAVEIMWQRDCGAVPVIDGEMKVIGMITDRDISVAAGSRNQKLSEIKIGEVIGNKVFTCFETDDAEDALKKMRRAKVKRLPVVERKRCAGRNYFDYGFNLKSSEIKKERFFRL